jgi:hypothetical protein
MATALTVAHDLLPAERLVAVHLLTAFTNRQTGLAYPSQSTLARAFRVHRATVSRWLAALREKGYLESEAVRRQGKFDALQFAWLWKPEYERSRKPHRVARTRHGEPPTVSHGTVSHGCDTTSSEREPPKGVSLTSSEECEPPKGVSHNQSLPPKGGESSNNKSSSQAHARKPRVKREHRKLMESTLAQSTLEALRKIQRFRATTIRKSDGTPALWVYELAPLADKLESATIASNMARWIEELECPSTETPVVAVRNAVYEEIDFQQRFQAEEPVLLERIEAARENEDMQALVILAESEFASIQKAAVAALEELEEEQQLWFRETHEQAESR